MALVAHSQAQGLLAQEKQKPVPTIYEGPVGPYRMIVQAIPNPPTQGLLNLHASVKDPNTGTDVDDASIVVFAQRHESSERGRARFFTSPEYPASYSTQLNLLEEGYLDLHFEVSGPLGKGSAEVVLLVTEQPRSLAGWLAWGWHVRGVAVGAVPGLAQRQQDASSAGPLTCIKLTCTKRVVRVRPHTPPQGVWF